MMSERRAPVEPPVPPGRKWLWADGHFHAEPPPSIKPIPMPPVPPVPEATPPVPAATDPALPEVAAAFVFSDRARLRVQALDFAIRSASLLQAKVRNGAELLAEAEHIERWIAKP